MTIFQGVTLGEWHGNAPIIKSYTSIFAGAKNICGMRIGMRCFIGANAVVVADVPAWYSDTGVPAKNQIRSDYDENCSSLIYG